MNEKWLILNKSARWWRGSKELKKWIIKSGEDYWIVNGSEFPEKKLVKSSPFDIKNPKRRTKKSASLNTKHFLLILLASGLGISLAMNLIFYLTK